MDVSVGERFGKLIVIGLSKRRASNKSILRECVCDCGKETEVQLSNLKSGATKSCGCLMKKGNSSTHKDSNSPTYISWSSMRTRCKNPNASNYNRYGGSGVSICPEWDSYIQFKQDMGERPVDTSIDRINPYGNYEPSNCQWANVNQQRSNRR